MECQPKAARPLLNAEPFAMVSSYHSISIDRRRLHYRYRRFGNTPASGSVLRTVTDWTIRAITLLAASTSSSAIQSWIASKSASASSVKLRFNTKTAHDVSQRMALRIFQRAFQRAFDLAPHPNFISVVASGFRRRLGKARRRIGRLLIRHESNLSFPGHPRHRRHRNTPETAASASASPYHVTAYCRWLLGRSILVTPPMGSFAGSS
jgi:hypothetical protein